MGLPANRAQGKRDRAIATTARRLRRRCVGVFPPLFFISIRKSKKTPTSPQARDAMTRYGKTALIGRKTEVLGLTLPKYAIKTGSNQGEKASKSAIRLIQRKRLRSSRDNTSSSG